jgi:hypothetical protein
MALGGQARARQVAIEFQVTPALPLDWVNLSGSPGREFHRLLPWKLKETQIEFQDRVRSRNWEDAELYVESQKVERAQAKSRKRGRLARVTKGAPEARTQASSSSDRPES